MAQNIFGSSRRKLTILYSIVMTIFLVTLLFAMLVIAAYLGEGDE